MKRVLIISLLCLVALLVGCTATDPVVDDLYFQGDVYVWDGAAWQLLNGGFGAGAEVDPVFTGSPAFGILAGDILFWDGHSVLTTGIHGVGAGDIVGTTLLQELDSKTLDASVGKGTWTASGIWKLPAMFFNGDITTDRWLSQDNNTFIGADVVGGGNLAHTVGAEGWHNTFIGHSAGHFITTGSFNNAWGAHSLFNITTGNGNTAIGSLAGNKINTGSWNVAIGDSAGPTVSGDYGLFIDISETDTPLIWGNFNTDDVHLFAATKLGIDNTNYASFADDGTLTLVGTATVEKDVEIPLTAFGKGVAAPATVYIGNYIGYEYTTNDTAYFCTEVPYDWDSSSDLQIELHWYIDEAYATAPNGEVRWNLIYTATKEDGTEAVDAATATIDSGDINIPATAKRLVQTELAIPAAALQAHDVIGVQVKRVALVAGNNPTAKPTLIGAMIQYMSNKLGQ